MTNTFLVILILLTIAGCNMNGTADIKISRTHTTPPPTHSFGRAQNVTVSPAMGYAQGTHSAAEISIGNQDHKLSGSNTSGSFSIYSSK